MLHNGGVDEAKGRILLEENRNRLPLVNRNSLDETLFRDRHPRLKITKKVPPFVDQSQESNIVYNKLQLVSAASLLLVWDYLAKNLATYMQWYANSSVSVLTFCHYH